MDLILDLNSTRRCCLEPSRSVDIGPDSADARGPGEMPKEVLASDGSMGLRRLWSLCLGRFRSLVPVGNRCPTRLKRSVMSFSLRVRFDQGGGTIIELFAARRDLIVLAECGTPVIVTALVLGVVGWEQTVIAIWRTSSGHAVTRRSKGQHHNHCQSGDVRVHRAGSEIVPC